MACDQLDHSVKRQRHAVPWSSPDPGHCILSQVSDGLADKMNDHRFLSHPLTLASQQCTRSGRSECWPSLTPSISANLAPSEGPVSSSPSAATVLPCSVPTGQLLDMTVHRKRRLCGKQPGPSGASNFWTIDGFALDVHPAYKNYIGSDADTRRLVRKRVWQSKHRLLATLKTTGSAQIGQNEVIFVARNADIDDPTLVKFDDQFFWDVARDRKKPANIRGYAIWWLVQKSKHRDCTDGHSFQEMWIYGVAVVLLTYQSDKFVINPESVRQSVPLVGSSESSTLELLRRLNLSVLFRFLRVHETVVSLKQGLLDVAVRSCAGHPTARYSFAIELCLPKWLEKGVLEVQAHLWMELPESKINVSDAAVCNATPFVNWTWLANMSGSSSRIKEEPMAGSFFCCVEKRSTIVSETTVIPWRDYSVKVQWITALYSADEVNASVAAACFFKTEDRVQHNIAQLEYSEACKRKVALEAMWVQNEAILRPLEQASTVLRSSQQARRRCSEVKM